MYNLIAAKKIYEAAIEAHWNEVFVDQYTLN